MDSQPSTPWTPQTRNPVALRVYKLLGTNYDDPSTRAALRTLSEIYPPSIPQTSTAEHPPRTIDHDEDADEDGLSALRPVTVADSAYEQSLVQARKGFRQDMEAQLISCSQQYLKQFGAVNQRLDELQSHVTSMRACCDNAEAQLAAANTASHALLERAATLRAERSRIDTRLAIANTLLERFTLSQPEIDALTARGAPLNAAFFSAMANAERIHGDCRLLLAATEEDAPVQAGLDIMASTAEQLEAGYDKSFRWSVNVMRQMGRDATLDVPPTLRDAVRLLRRRPALLSDALAALSSTRQSALLSSFTRALTRGPPRPLELLAHDGPRYVGAMLAWVHQAVAAEHEFLESLFGVQADGRMPGAIRSSTSKARTSEEEETQKWIRELMDAALGALVTPLKSRIGQTARAQESALVSYRLAGLVRFYALTMGRTLGKQASLVTALQEIMDGAYKVFHDAVQTQGRALLRATLDLNDQSLNPPQVLLEHAAALRSLMTVHAEFLTDEASPPGYPSDEDRLAEKDKDDFSGVLDVLVAPATEWIQTVAEEKKRVRPNWDAQVFVLNCLAYLEGVLEPYEFATAERESIRKILAEHVEVVIDEHYNNILADTSLAAALAACEARSPSDVLSRGDATSPGELQYSLAGFATWLSGPEVVASPRFTKLSSQRTAVDVHHAALAKLARAYQHLCEEVRRPENRYEAASTLLGTQRPFGQVHLLWQIFGLQDEVS